MSKRILHFSWTWVNIFFIIHIGSNVKNNLPAPNVHCIFCRWFSIKYQSHNCSVYSHGENVWIHYCQILCLMFPLLLLCCQPRVFPDVHCIRASTHRYFSFCVGHIARICLVVLEVRLIPFPLNSMHFP